MIRRTFIVLSIGAATLAAQAATQPSAPTRTAEKAAPAAAKVSNAPAVSQAPLTIIAAKQNVSKPAHKPIRIAQSHSRGLVPPPPPETPSLMSAPFTTNPYSQQYTPVELLSADSLKERQKQLTTQLQKAKIESKDKQLAIGERAERAKQFEGLFNEGVISRRELEFAQGEAKDARGEYEDSKNKVQDLQFALLRVNEKLKNLSKMGIHPKIKTASKSKGKTDKAAASVPKDKVVVKPATAPAAAPAPVATAPATTATPAPSTSSATSVPATSAKPAPSVVPQAISPQSAVSPATAPGASTSSFSTTIAPAGSQGTAVQSATPPTAPVNIELKKSGK